MKTSLAPLDHVHVQDVILRVRESLQHDPSCQRPEHCVGIQSVALDAILDDDEQNRHAEPTFDSRSMASLSQGRERREGDADMVADMVACGDGGFYCDRIVTPMFYFLSHEVGRNVGMLMIVERAEVGGGVWEGGGQSRGLSTQSLACLGARGKNKVELCWGNGFLWFHLQGAGVEKG